MAISTNGAIITRVTSALYGEYLSNASYDEVSTTAPATLAASFLANDFAGKTDLQIATTMLTNLGLTSITGLDNWLSAQLTASGSTTAAKGAKIVSILNDYANMTSDATYGSYATSFNAKVSAGLVKSQTAGNAGGSYATADAVSATNATYTLTTGIDTPVGGAGNDSVLGTIDSVTVATNTFSVADVINGGAGTDTLQVTVSNITGATTITPTQVTGIESVRVINVDPTPDAFTVDLTAVTGVTSVEASTSSGAVTYSNIANASVALNAIANTAAVSFNVKTTALTGTADAVNLNLTSNNGSVTVNTNGAGFEAANISVAGTNAPTSLIGAGADIKTATITGAGSLTIDGASLTAVKTLDASKNTGGVTYTATAANASLTGGEGNDVLGGAAGNDVILGGAGNDSITAGAGNDSVDGGAGNDRVTLTDVTKNDSAQGGDGTDTLSIAAAIAYSASSSTDDSVNIKGFETLSASASLTQNMLGLDANNTISTFTIGANTPVTVLQNAANLTAVNAAAAGTVTLGLKTNGTADALAVTVGSASGSSSSAATLNATQIETMTVNSVGADSNSLTLGLTNAGDGVTAATSSTATSLKSLTITGSKSLTVTGSGADTALATVNAADFTGSSLSVSNSGSTAAMTVTATGNYNATITTGTGADNIAGGSGNDVLNGGTGADTISGGAGNDTITGSTGANVMTGGTGDDTISGTTDADNADGGDGNDNISVGDGANTVVGGAGDDTILSGTGADSVTGGDGNDSITTSSGNDTVDSGDGADTINVGAGNDSVTAGGGNDTIDGGTGDDVISGGDGNDNITIASLTNGDNIDGGAGTADRLTITAVASDATPTGITNVEDIRITTIGGGATGITVDLTKVTGITAIVSTIDQDGVTTLAVKNLPSTVATISLADDGVTTETNTFTYSSGPSALTYNSFGNEAAATNITSLNAPLTVNAKLNTDLAGDAQVYVAQKTNLGTLTTDATTISITTDALSAAITGTEATVGDITDNVIQALTVTGATYADVTVGTLSTSSAELASVSVTAGANATTTMGAITANSATALTLTANSGAQSTLVLGDSNSATSAAVTLSMNLGDQSTITGNADVIIGKSIASSNVTVGAGVGASGAYEALPTLEVGSSTGTTNTIGSVTINAGVASYVSQTIGTTKTATSIGAITAQGSGNITVTLGATSAATVTGGASAQGAISAASMTSPTSIFTVAGANAAAALTITGSAGPDVITVGTAVLVDTITGGSGNDSITLGSTGGADGGSDVVVLSVGSSNAVVVTGGGEQNDTGGDNLYAFGIDGLTDKIRLNITSADTAWDITTHVLIGAPAGAGTAIGSAAAYVAGTYLVQVGDISNTDGFDIAANVYTTLDSTTNSFSSNAEAQAATVVNLTGTSGADTLVTGANNDTISGGAGNDNITGGAGADSLTGGAGNDVFVLTTTSSVATSASDVTKGASTTLVDNGDTFTFATGITFAQGTGVDVITDFATGDTLDVTTAGTTYIDLNGSTAATALAANSHYYLQGTYVASTGVFTVNSAATATTSGVALLLVADGIANTLANQTGVVILPGVLASSLTVATFV